MAVVHRDSFVAGQYFLGVAGMAVMRRVLSRPSEGRPRVVDIRQIIATFDEFPNDLAIEVLEHDVDSGYTAWAPIYDGPNPMIEAEEPIVRKMIEGIEAGTALDAGCGTGRHAGFLATLGIETTGVDATVGMLDLAREAFPSVDFRRGRLEALPADNDSFDLVTSALAVCHAPDLAAVFAEFARVVKPGGTVIVSDPHPVTVQFGAVAGFRNPDENPNTGFTLPYVANLHHPLHAYVNAAVAVGLKVIECQEPPFTESALTANPAHGVLPEAVEQAFRGLPYVVVWRFEKPC